MKIIFTTTGNGKIKASAADAGDRRATPLGERDEAAVVSQLQSLATPASGLIPPGVRWISASGRQVLFERPPRRMRIRYSPQPANNANPRYRDVELELPWTVYAISFGPDYRVRNLTVYGASRSLGSVDDAIGYLPLSNTHGDGHFCLPANQPEAADLAEAIQNAYQMMWHSDFNMDVWDIMYMALEGGHPAAMAGGPQGPTAPRAARLLTRWSELSQAEVLSISDWPRLYTVGQVIASLQNFAGSSFTGWHLMSTAKTAFMTAGPAGPGSVAQGQVDIALRRQMAVAEDQAAIRVMAERAEIINAPAPVVNPTGDLLPLEDPEEVLARREAALHHDRVMGHLDDDDGEEGPTLYELDPADVLHYPAVPSRSLTAVEREELMGRIANDVANEDWLGDVRAEVAAMDMNDVHDAQQEASAYDDDEPF